ARLAARRHRAGDLVALDLAERLRQREGLRLAIGGRDGDAAALPGREAAVDAITVGVVGNDEGAILSRRGRRKGERTRNRESQARNGSHSPGPNPNARWARSLRLEALRDR